MTFEELEQLISELGFAHTSSPEKQFFVLAFRGLYGHHQVLLVPDGGSVQIRTIQYAICSPESPHIAPLLSVLADINQRRRFAKFGYNADDGEISASADLMLCDVQATKELMGTFIQHFIVVIDVLRERLIQVTETGQDPGEPDPKKIARDLERAARSAGGEAGHGGSGGGLRGLIERLRGRGKPQEPSDGGTIEEV